MRYTSSVSTSVISIAILIGGSTMAASQDPNLDLKTLNRELDQSLVIAEQCPPKIQDIVPCLKEFSAAGNGAASEALAQLYADPHHYGEPSGLSRDKVESIRYMLLAIKQGSLTACKFVPGWAFKPEIGMTDVQVRASQLGNPKEVTSEETEARLIERWHYDDATLTFERSPWSARYKILKKIETRTTP